MINITLSEKTKAIILSVAVVIAALGFANISGLIEQFPKDFEVIITAVSSLVSVITAYFKKAKDVIEDPK
jgi:hypothetical protein